MTIHEIVTKLLALANENQDGTTLDVVFKSETTDGDSVELSVDDIVVDNDEEDGIDKVFVVLSV